jgi:hypothetical protein
MFFSNIKNMNPSLAMALTPAYPNTFVFTRQAPCGTVKVQLSEWFFVRFDTNYRVTWMLMNV